MQRLVRQLRGKIRRSLARRGAVKTLLEVPPYLMDALRARLPAQRRLLAEHLRHESAFDAAHNVDTAGRADLSALDVVGRNRDHGHYYHGVDAPLCRRIVGALPIDHPRYTFVDFGSGKGKALLVAAEWPFASIVGVEFAKELHDVAESNIRSYRNPRQQCRAVSSVWMDAAQYDLPRGSLVLFFYNPFNEVVLNNVLANVQASLAREPRDVWACYANPYAHAPLDDASFAELALSGPGYRIYRFAA